MLRITIETKLSPKYVCKEQYLTKNHVTGTHNQESAFNPLWDPIPYSILHVSSITPIQLVDNNLLRKLDLVEYGSRYG